MKSVMNLALPILIAATGCIPEHDYSGDYDMTYAVLMSSPDGARTDARAGTAQVEVNQGLNSEYLVNLGPAFCRLEGAYIEAETEQDWPFLDVRPQECFFSSSGKTYAMSVTGTATFDDRKHRLEIVLSGTYVDDVNKTHGSATLDFNESW